MHGKAEPDTTSHDNRRLIPASEVWALLSLSERQFRRLTKQGAIKTVKQGRNVYVPREAIDAYIAGLSDESAA